MNDGFLQWQNTQRIIFTVAFWRRLCTWSTYYFNNVCVSECVGGREWVSEISTNEFGCGGETTVTRNECVSDDHNFHIVLGVHMNTSNRPTMIASHKQLADLMYFFVLIDNGDHSFSALDRHRSNLSPKISISTRILSSFIRFSSECILCMRRTPNCDITL